MGGTVFYSTERHMAPERVRNPIEEEEEEALARNKIKGMRHVTEE